MCHVLQIDYEGIVSIVEEFDVDQDGEVDFVTSMPFLLPLSCHVLSTASCPTMPCPVPFRSLPESSPAASYLIHSPYSTV